MKIDDQWLCGIIWVIEKFNRKCKNVKLFKFLEFFLLPNSTSNFNVEFEGKKLK